MKNTTQGAWLINHTKKLQDARNIAHDFEDIELSGKCGILLSNLAASDEESTLTPAKVDAIRQVSGIKKAEMPAITDLLAKANLVEKGDSGEIVVLGVTTASVLGHTSDIFKNSDADNFQKAAIELSEQTSDMPKDEKVLKEYISDEYKLTKQNIEGLFSQVELFGFIDSEKIDEKKMYFNGNLFRHSDLKKVTAVLSSLSAEDNRKVTELESLLTSKGCVSIKSATKILGQILIDKLKAIGMYDLNEVSNEKENIIFITKPSAFNKFGNPFEEDALDLAKAFVASLYYGINYSPANRGNITMLHALINKLVRGYEVGPATAIGQDYKILEFRRVIKVRPNPDGYGFFMKLLKKDIGILALQVLQQGDITEQVINQGIVLDGAITHFNGPEKIRQEFRSTQSAASKLGVSDMLRTFRA